MRERERERERESIILYWLSTSLLTLSSQDCPELIKKQLELTIDGVNVKNKQPLGSIIVSAIFRPVAAVATSEHDVQRSVVDTGNCDNNGVGVTESADSANAPSVVGGVSGETRNILMESGRYIGNQMANRVCVRTCVLHDAGGWGEGQNSQFPPSISLYQPMHRPYI